MFAANMNRRISDDLQYYLKNHSRDIYNSFSPISWLLNCFAINSNVVKDVPCPNVFKCFFAFTVLGSLNIFSLYYKNEFYRYTAVATSVKLTDRAQTVYDLFQYFVDLWLAYKCGRHVSQEYFKQYEQIDAFLGMIYYNKIKWELLKLLSIFTFIWFSSSACDYLAWLLSYGWRPTTAFSVAYIFLFIKILTTLDLSAHVMHIRFRLKIISDIVHNYYSVTETLPGFMEFSMSNKNCLYGNMCGKEIKRYNKIRLRSIDDYKDVNLLTRCYLQLTEQVAFINRIFGFRILLNSLSLMIDIIRYTNIAVRIILGTQLIPNSLKYFPAVSIMMRQLTCVLVLVSLVNQCEIAYRQKDKIIRTIDHLLVHKDPNDKLRVAMAELRALIQARPLTFSLANFFKVNNGLLISIASAVVTYTIIILQSMN